MAAKIVVLLPLPSHIHAITKYVVTFDDHITQVDAYTELDHPVLGQVGIPGSHAPLDFHGTGYCIHYAGKLGQYAVTCGLEDSALMFDDPWVDQFGAKLFECRQGAQLVGAHEAAIADDVRSKDGSQMALYCILNHPVPAPSWSLGSQPEPGRTT